MAIVVTIEHLLAAKKLKAKELAAAIGVSETHMSLFRSGKVRGVRFSTLSNLCAALRCQPGDILRYRPGPDDGDEDIIDD